MSNEINMYLDYVRNIGDNDGSGRPLGGGFLSDWHKIGGADQTLERSLLIIKFLVRENPSRESSLDSTEQSIHLRFHSRKSPDPLLCCGNTFM